AYVKEFMGRKVEITITGLRNRDVMLVMPSRLSVQGSQQLYLPMGKTEAVLKVRINGTEPRGLEKMCHAVIEDATQPVLDYLANQLPALETATTERRRAGRHRVAFQVMGKDLPGYKAMAMDLSVLGVRLRMEGEIAVGTTLDLHLDFDVFSLPGITAHAEVRWCVPNPDGKGWVAGLEFVRLPEDDREAIERYLQNQA
ncbi:MAG: PilZ domain-containing protein, partial [Candidatus Xenobia bacterium]